MSWAQLLRKREEKILDYFTSRSEMLKRIISVTGSGKALEVGLGSGRSSIALKDVGIDVFGIDVERNMLKLAKEYQRKFDIEFPLILCDMFLLPFRKMSFETVFSQGVLEHFNEKHVIKALKEQGRVGKKIVIDVPIKKEKDSELGQIIAYYWPLRKWRYLIAIAGLKILGIYGWGIDRKVDKILWLILPSFFTRKFPHSVTTNVGFVCVSANDDSPN